MGASLLQWIRRIKRFSRLACPMCLVSDPGNESCVHCPLTETGGWWPWGVPIFSVTGRWKQILTYPSQIHQAKYFCEMCLVYSRQCLMRPWHTGHGGSGLSGLYPGPGPGWHIDSVGGCGEQGLAPAPLTSLSLKMKVVAKPVLGIAPHRVGTSLNKSLLILITFPQARCCSDLDFPGYCRVMLSHVHRDQAVGEILLVLLDFPCPVQYSFFASVSLECVRVTTRYRISI